LPKSAASKAFHVEEFLATAGKGRTIAKYCNNAQIYAQGDDAEAIFYIQSGEVKVTVVSEQGREAVIAILGKDEFFGEG
jgi:CRP/FNR family cyclic AMP-dependent transcriptional regulator